MLDAAGRSRSGLIRFGLFEVDQRSGELRKQGVKVKLQDQPFLLLQMLLEHPGHIVTREELQKRIWPSDTFVDFEQGLNNAAKRLREALSDSADAPCFIETIPRRGYRFIASINVGPRQMESLVVLPLENLSRDPEQEYFADGLTEALINSLGKIAALQVISRTTSMRYKKTDKTLPQIARELNVDAIIEGTVLRSGERVRISVQLIDAHADTHLWAQNYDRDLRDILALHTEVAQAVAREVQVKLTPLDQARFATAHAVEPEAYDAYLKGRYQWNRRPTRVLEARKYFELAVTKDPTYAAAYAGLADYHSSLGVWGLVPANEGCVKAKVLALKALELDPGLAEAHTAVALATMYHYDFFAAEREFERALEINPRYAAGHQLFGLYLAMMGRYEEAYTECQRAFRLDPLAVSRNLLGYNALYSRRWDQAIDQFIKILEVDPEDGPALCGLGWGYSCKGLHELAIAALRKGVNFWPGTSPLTLLGEAYALAGHRDKAQKVLEQLLAQSKERYLTPYGVARIYNALGEKDEALRWLETSSHQQAEWLLLLKVDSHFDNLRTDPRFHDLMRRMNFPT